MTLEDFIALLQPSVSPPMQLFACTLKNSEIYVVRSKNSAGTISTRQENAQRTKETLRDTIGHLDTRRPP